jgi:hypothetical protein
VLGKAHWTGKRCQQGFALRIARRRDAVEIEGYLRVCGAAAPEDARDVVVASEDDGGSPINRLESYSHDRNDLLTIPMPGFANVRTS